MLDIKCVVLGSLQNNCYLIIDKASGKSALVDCTDCSEKMHSLIDGADLEYILLTHGHFDHIGGVAEVKALTGASVVISADDEDMLTSSRKSLAAFCGAAHNDVKADLVVNDGDVITLGESKIKVMSTPGHTQGSACYICDNVVFSGDTLFYCSCGRTDFPSGSTEQMLLSLERLAALDGDYIVYPGHDRQTTLDFERKNNPYINR